MAKTTDEKSINPKLTDPSMELAKKYWSYV